MVFGKMHTAVIGIFLSLVVVSAASNDVIAADDLNAVSELKKHATAMIDWLKGKGGFFNDKLEIRYENGRMGMFTNSDLKEDDVLLVIPRSCLITAGDNKEKFGGMWCPTVYNLIKEMKLGDESDFAPYVNYLLTQRPGQLPSAWSDAGQRLLLELVAQDDTDPRNNLRPEYVTAWITDEWYNDCKGGDDPFEQNAALLLVQRGWDDLLIPVYDMMNHANGKRLNTKSNSVHKKKPITVQAMRDIKAGEELFLTYNFCTDCGNKLSGYGTPEILRDFGFVEDYPQMYFLGRKINFIIDEDEKDPTNLKIEWIERKPKKKSAKKFLQFQLERLTELGDVFDLDPAVEQVPNHELAIIKQYREALITAMTYALKDMGVKFDDGKCESGDGSCGVAARYDDLGYVPDPIDYAVYTCDTSKSMSYKGFEVVEKLHSHYQKIDYLKDPKNDNVCFDISNIIQMCGSYRPHYHEMVVHFTARYIETVKRVLWVGGGDSMLLHEILKYPSLEKVVGLELDQVITRLSFKHFGTQPHFDNEKVEWWFGDAAKSLLMLPEDYFGSFDMVLVDLSETVMSFLVTSELDIFSALGLLLKPEGVQVKNELYLEKMSDIFDYSIQIHVPGQPVMCSQCLIFGSNKVDFLYADLHDHKLDHPTLGPNLYIKPQSEIKDRFEIFHDYRRNSTSVHLCKEEGEPEKVPEVQVRSPGILLVLEAEDSTADLKDTESLKTALVKAIEEEGYEVVLTGVAPNMRGSAISIILREGYVLTRVWPHYKHCSIDIHLWSKFEKHEPLKRSIIHAVGSKGGTSSSSYRIVAGGMFGVNTWKDDDKKRGPRILDTCNRAAGEKARAKAMKKDVADKVFAETLALIEETDIAVAVLCGAKKGDCKSLDLFKKKPNVQVIPLLSCPDIDNEFAETAFQTMMDCEKQIFATLTAAISTTKKVRAIIVDPTTTRAFSKVAYKVFKAKKGRLFNVNNLAAMAIMFEDSESWRRNFLERFRTDIVFDDPCFRAEVLFNNTDSTIEVGVLSSGDAGFFSRFRTIVSTIETKTGLVSDIRNIQGGPFVEDPNWKPSHFFLPEDYNQNPPLEQWKSQRPLGLQTVSQLEQKKPDEDIGLSAEKIKKALRDTLSSINSVTWQELEEMENAEIYQDSEAGDGTVIIALWAGGNCVVLWDGRSHIDLNFFTFAEDDPLANEFVVKFKSHFPKKFSTNLQDVQPRGFGRVVNFLSDILPRQKPHWAKFKEQTV